MNTRFLITTTAAFGAGLGVLSALAACASDETNGAVDGDASATVSAPDSGTDNPSNADAATDAPPPVPCTADTLCENSPFTEGTAGGALDGRTRIVTIRGRSANDVWAVGARGAAAHFDGTGWSLSDVGAFQTLIGLWLRDDGEVALTSPVMTFARDVAVTIPDAGTASPGGWIAGGAPAGFVKASANYLEAEITSAWAAPAAEWAWYTSVTYEGTNGLWRLHVSPTSNQFEVGSVFGATACQKFPCQKMTSVHGATADDLWAVGYTGATFHITDAQSATPTIQPFDSQTWAELDGVWAVSATEAWAVGGAGTIRHWTGQPSSWDVVSNVPTTEKLHAVWGSSATDVWAVGDNAVVLHYDGTKWSSVQIAGLGARHPDLYTVWSPSPGHVWIGGDGIVLSVGGKP